MLSNEFIFSQVYDHYKESVMYLKNDLVKRDKVTLLSLILLVIYFLIEFKTIDSVFLANKWVEKNLNLSLNINYNLLTTAILLLLLWSTMKYFQLCLNIEKQYNYIHEVEAELNKLADKDIITREGYSYLNDYPLLSALIHRLYNFFIPILLIFSMIFKVFKILYNFNGISSFLNIFIVSLIILCTFLYMLFTYRDINYVSKINYYIKKLFVLIHLYKEDN